MQTVMKALFGDGGVLRCHCLSKNNTSAASPLEPAAPFCSVEAAAVADDVLEVTRSEVIKATRSFSRAALIGQGRFADVYRASLRSGRLAAAKRLRPPPSGTWHASDFAFLWQQLSVASRLRHHNVVRLIGYTIAADLRCVLYEFADVGTLHDVLHGTPSTGPPRGEPEATSSGRRLAVLLSWEQRVRIALDAARGLAYLHEVAAVTHGDVRSTNVLLFEGFRAKIGDYKMFMELPVHNMYARVFEHAGCQAPEHVDTDSMTEKSDVFSFGVVLLELLTGREPDDVTQGRRKLAHWAPPLLTEGRIEECIDPKLDAQYPRAEALKLGRIAAQCLQHDPKSRPSMSTVTRLISYDVVGNQHGGGAVVAG